MKVNLLRAKIVENGMTANSMCDEIGMSKSAFYRKINGTSDFYREEIAKIVKVLHLTPEDTFNIFFEAEVT